MDLYFHDKHFLHSNFFSTALTLLLLLPLTLFAQNPPVINSRLSGVVIDAKTKETLPGATITIKGITNNTTTDAKGEFELRTAQIFPYSIVITYIGYKTKEIVVDGSPVTIQLESDEKQLNDVVVVGYGTQKRADVTGSVSSIAKTALQQPVTSFDQALKGAAPGIQVTQTTGQPGGGVSIRIRGGSSIQGGNEPLYVIDGFPVYNSGTTAGTLSGTPVNPLSSINPGDIESIDILKDASATAIYGSRGANGVVIVTTKKGKADKSSVSYEGTYGTQSLRKKVDVLNAHDFAILRNDALYDATPAKGKYQYLSQQQIDQLGEGTDWQAAAFRNAPMQTHQVTLSGGSVKARYLISANYQDQKGIVKNTDFKRLGFRANVDAQAFERLKVSASLSLSKSDANVSPNGIINSLLIMPPTATIYEANGGYTLRNPFENIFANPIATILEVSNKSTTNRVLGTTFAEYKIINGLTFKVLFGADVNTISEKRYLPNSIYEGSLTRGWAGRGSLESYSWLNENTLTYDKTWANHTINILGGFTQQSFSRENFTASSQNFVTDELTYNSLQGGSVLIAPTSDATTWNLQSYLGRINYNYNRRYYLTASLRADGSSRFGKGNKWGYFPSAAASWNISNESFFEGLNKAVSDLKFRVSYGKTGNLEIGEYQSLATLATYTYLFGGNMITGFAPNRISNDKLSWEKTDQYNAGLDIGFFDNRLQLNIDAYYKKTSNLLLNVQLPWTSGFDSSLQNFGSVENKGLELALSSQNFTGPFRWNTQFNISFNRNKVLALGNGATTYITGNYIIQVGQPLGNFFGSITDGILQTGEEAAKGKYTGSAVPKPGDRLYKDINSDGIFTTAADKAIIGNAQPDFLAGLTNTFSYKGFDLLVFVQGAYGNQILNTNRQNLELFTGQQNAAASALDRWTPTNPSQTIPRAKLDPAPVFSDRFIEDGSFVRLKNVNLTYNLPKHWVVKAGLSSASIYVSGQNLITWTKYSGYDPEITSGSNVSPGTDAGIYPVSKTYFVGLRLGF